ncbi:MAG: exodeoxyribonuclease VII large subunit, partial [Rhodobacteraceae bacterium]|nr:exodeoxyribonuclease VII large subunit [Paracoccaceae bacterium]
RLAALERMRQTLGYGETLKRGYAVVRAGARVVTARAAAQAEGALEVEFHDGRLAVLVTEGDALPAKPRPLRDKTAGGADQGSLF